MKVFENSAKAPSKTSANSKEPTQRVSDSAAQAGLSKVEFYKTDKWIVGREKLTTYVVPKNTIPEPLAKAFIRAAKPDPVRDEIDYDDTKFMLDDVIDDGCDRVTISLRSPSKEVADVEFDKDSFVIRIFDIPRSGVFSFNKDEFLKAVDAAKWSLEMYVLRSSDSEPDKL